jgi:hypothetical protein
MTTNRTILWSLACLGLFACSETASGGGGGGLAVPDANATSSSSSSSGSSGGANDAGAGSSSGDATAGEDVGGGPIDAKKCVAQGKGDCDEASECGSEQYCDPCLRKCLAPRNPCDPCTADIQCAKAEHGSACLPYASGGTFCGHACQSDVGCPKGFACKTVAGLSPPQDKQCVPKTGTCGKSTDGCKLDSDCPFTKICNAEFGVCIKGCAAKESCPTGKVCSLFRCSDPCTGDSECAKLASEAKCDGGICKIPGGCLGPPDCPDKATYCDLKAHKCKPGCQVDPDCKETAKKCEAGACVEKGCLENWECAFEQVCDTTVGKCKKAEGKFCAKCDSKDAKATACDGEPNKCFAFEDKDGKKLGEFCAVVCSSAASGACPQGYQCQEVPDDKGNPIGKFCMRQCWQTPV